MELQKIHVHFTPVEVLLPWNHNAVDVITGQYYACTLLENGEVWCWGHNNYRQLGNTTTSYSKIPVRVDLPEGKNGDFNQIFTTPYLCYT